MNPLRLYRNFVFEICRHGGAIEGYTDSQFHSYLKAGHQEAKASLMELQQRVTSEVEIQLAYSALFVFAAGLLTFGHLDVVDDILDGIPYISLKAKVSRLAWTISTLMPLPDKLDPREDAEAVRNWFQQHRVRLRWNEQEQRFVLEG